MAPLPIFMGDKLNKSSANSKAIGHNPTAPKKGQGPQTFPGGTFGTGLDTKDPNVAFNPPDKPGKGPQVHTPGHTFGKTLDTTDRPLNPK